MRVKLITATLILLAYLPLSVNRLMGRFIGRMLYFCNVRECQTTQTNLALCYPEKTAKERQQLCKKVLEHSACWPFEIGKIWLRGAAYRKSMVQKFVRVELFEEAVASPRGLLLIVPHFGNWEQVALFAFDNTKGTALYSEPKNKVFNDVLRKGRLASKQISLVPANVKGVMAVFKALKRGEMTVVLPDQVPIGAGGIYSPFFGHTSYTQTLIKNLIKKAKPIVLQGYAMRTDKGFELGFLKPDDAIYSEDPQTSIDAMNKGVEAVCVLDTAQYQWTYKRFKNQKDGVDLYAKFNSKP